MGRGFPGNSWKGGPLPAEEGGNNRVERPCRTLLALTNLICPAQLAASLFHCPPLAPRLAVSQYSFFENYQRSCLHRCAIPYCDFTATTVPATAVTILIQCCAVWLTPFSDWIILFPVPFFLLESLIGEFL